MFTEVLFEDLIKRSEVAGHQAIRRNEPHAPRHIPLPSKSRKHSESPYAIGPQSRPRSLRHFPSASGLKQTTIHPLQPHAKTASPHRLAPSRLLRHIVSLPILNVNQKCPSASSLEPSPRATKCPALNPVTAPSRYDSTPLTQTASIPSASCRGSANVAVSRTLSASNSTRSA